MTFHRFYEAEENLLDGNDGRLISGTVILWNISNAHLIGNVFNHGRLFRRIWY